MKCPYQIGVDCRYVDASATEKSCEECELYNNGAYNTGCEKQTTILAVILILLYLLV